MACGVRGWTSHAGRQDQKVGSPVLERVRPEFPIEKSSSGSDSQAVGKWLAAATRSPQHSLKDTAETCSLPPIQSESKADVVLIVFQPNGQEKTNYVIHVVVFKGAITTHIPPNPSCCQSERFHLRSQLSSSNGLQAKMLVSSSAKGVADRHYLRCFPIFISL